MQDIMHWGVGDEGWFSFHFYISDPFLTYFWRIIRFSISYIWIWQFDVAIAMRAYANFWWLNEMTVEEYPNYTQNDPGIIL